MCRSNVVLRPLPSLLEQARRVARDEGVALNQLINVAMAEKLSALRTERTLREYAVRADRPRTLETLARVGLGKPPREGDELPGG
jgi:hypothetical protein